MKCFLLFAFVVLFSSCARVQTLNLKSHSYSERPKHIVWIQVAGFSEEHIPLLKFNLADTAYKTNIEQVSCMGKMWNYNLYELRPLANNSFMSQITGSKNIKGTCEDAQNLPAWSYLSDIGYEAAVLENGASDEQSFEKLLSCPENKMINLEKMRYWKMGPDVKAGIKTFHYQDSPAQTKDSLTPGLYYDRSCQKGLCFSSVSNNFRALWGQLQKNRGKTFFLIRDFNFQKALLKKDISLVKESLQEIDRMVSIFADQNIQKDVLVIISGAESKLLEFPLEGKEWESFEKTGKNIIYKNSSLMSPVMASGAMAENFCGIFDESEMIKRVISKPSGKKFSWDSISPF
jgi:hypothetical protein